MNKSKSRTHLYGIEEISGWEIPLIIFRANSYIQKVTIMQIYEQTTIKYFVTDYIPSRYLHSVPRLFLILRPTTMQVMADSQLILVRENMCCHHANANSNGQTQTHCAYVHLHTHMHINASRIIAPPYKTVTSDGSDRWSTNWRVKSWRSSGDFSGEMHDATRIA